MALKRLPRQSRVCGFKTFVATIRCLWLSNVCRTIRCLLQNVCRDNQVFVALKRLSRQSGVCGFKTFAATIRCLWL